MKPDKWPGVDNPTAEQRNWMEAWRSAARDVSFHNAAEGAAYFAEGAGRASARQRLGEAEAKLRALGITEFPKGYLL